MYDGNEALLIGPGQYLNTYSGLATGWGRPGTTERIVRTGGGVNTGGQLGGGRRHAGHSQEEDEADGDHGVGGWVAGLLLQ